MVEELNECLACGAEYSVKDSRASDPTTYCSTVCEHCPECGQTPGPGGCACDDGSYRDDFYRQFD
jgi:hypothetical protein